jgi:phage-related holin
MKTDNITFKHMEFAKTQLYELAVLTKNMTVLEITSILSLITGVLSNFFSEMNYTTLAILIAVSSLDTVTGIWKARKNNSLETGVMAKLLTKAALYAITFFLGYTLTIVTDQWGFAQVFTFAGYSLHYFMIARESLSILENMEEIKPGSTPAWLMKYFKVYVKTGKTPENTASQFSGGTPVFAQMDKPIPNDFPANDIASDAGDGGGHE